MGIWKVEGCCFLIGVVVLVDVNALHGCIFLKFKENRIYLIKCSYYSLLNKNKDLIKMGKVSKEIFLKQTTVLQ